MGVFFILPKRTPIRVMKTTITTFPLLAQAGVLVSFSGGGGTPIYMANDVEQPIEWFTPQSEYRPTEYLQCWMRFWFDDEKRLTAAKRI
jgi:CRISPR-associated protein Cas1